MKAVMYHYVQEFNRDLPNFKFLDIKNFRNQLIFFKENYGFVTKDEWLDFVQYGRMPKQAGKIILTFDDAMSCHYDYVFPEIMDQNLWGIFYACTAPYSDNLLLDVHRIHLLCGAYDGDVLLKLANDLISDEMVPDINREKFSNNTYTTQKNSRGISDFKKLMNYFISYKYRSKVLDEIESILGGFVENASNFYVSQESLLEMRNNGMVIGSHSATHPVMSKLSFKEQEEELIKSFSIIDSLNDKGFRSYCHPYGGLHSFNDGTIEILNKMEVSYSFMVDPRDIVAKDFEISRNKLPRYDCNIFQYGQNT